MRSKWPHRKSCDLSPQSMKAGHTCHSGPQHQRQNKEGQWQRTTKEQKWTTDSGKGPTPDLKKQSGLRVLVHREVACLPNNWTLQALYSKTSFYSNLSADYIQNEKVVLYELKRALPRQTLFEPALGFQKSVFVSRSFRRKFNPQSKT